MPANPAVSYVPKKGKVAYLVGASEYGQGEKHVGSCNKNLYNLPNGCFAELLMGTALGHLPCGTKLRIGYRSSGEGVLKTVTAEKLDIGLGGGPVSGKTRRIDLYYQTAAKLGFHGLGVVVIETEDGSPLPGLTPASKSELEKYGFHNTTTGAGVLGTGVGPQTEQEGNEASENVKSAVEGAVEWTGELGTFLKFLTSSTGWERILKVTAGGIFLIMALDRLSKAGPTPTTNVGGTLKGAASKTPGIGKAVKLVDDLI